MVEEKRKGETDIYAKRMRCLFETRPANNSNEAQPTPSMKDRRAVVFRVENGRGQSDDHYSKRIIRPEFLK